MRLFQVGYKVNDIHRTIEAYSDLFGFEWEPVKEYALPTDADGREVSRTLVSHAKTDGGVELELVQTLEGVTSDVALMGGREGVSHIGLLVDDLEAAIARMTARGATVKFRGSAPRADWVFVIDDRLAGAMVQLVQLKQTNDAT